MKLVAFDGIFTAIDPGQVALPAKVVKAIFEVLDQVFIALKGKGLGAEHIPQLVNGHFR